MDLVVRGAIHRHTHHVKTKAFSNQCSNNAESAVAGRHERKVEINQFHIEIEIYLWSSMRRVCAAVITHILESFAETILGDATRLQFFRGKGK